MANSPPTRPSLLLRVRDVENHRAWEDFVRIYTPLIYGFCRKRGLQDADAADVAQEVLLAVARALQKFEYEPARGSFRSWLFTVTRNKFRNFLAARECRPQNEAAPGQTSVIDNLASPSAESDWDQEYHQRLFEWACTEIRGEFQDPTWQAFWLMTTEERSGKEVADQLGISVGAVYIARSRVTARLREKVLEVAGESMSPGRG